VNKTTTCRVCPEMSLKGVKIVGNWDGKKGEEEGETWGTNLIETVLGRKRVGHCNWGRTENGNWCGEKGGRRSVHKRKVARWVI